MAKINEYPLERFTFGDDDYYDIDYWDGAVYQSAKIKGSTIKAAMSGGGSILAADGQVMPADRSQDLANFKLSLRDGVFTLGTVDADFGSIFQATKDSGNTYATIKTKTNDNAGLILDINTADVTGAGNKTAMVQFRDAGVTKYIFGTNTDGVANFSDNSFFISSSALLTDYIQAIDRDTEAFVIGRQVGNPLNDNTKFLINNGNSFDATELDNVLMLSSRDETKKWLVDKDMFFSATKIKGDSTSGVDSQLLLQDSTGTDLWDFRNNGDVYQGGNSTHYINTGSKLVFDLGTTNVDGAFTIDGTNAANSTNLFEIIEAGGVLGFSVNEDGGTFCQSLDVSTYFQVASNQSGYWYSGNIRDVKIGKDTDEYVNFDANGVGFIDSGIERHRFGWGGGGSGQYTTFFRNGFSTNEKMIFGNTVLVNDEDFSVQGDMLTTGSLTLKNSLKHLGYTSSTAAPTVTELPNDKDYSIHKDTSAGTVYLAYNDGGTIKTTTLT